ncbi:phasin family protein [Zavarzinia sp. CC-PAN008]|uniref:phasin family protein n=1 Tax=Zavarzinia sp. CC-PAN008 TaxID=3243332 RepID=UPI003F7451C4
MARAPKAIAAAVEPAVEAAAAVIEAVPTPETAVKTMDKVAERVAATVAEPAAEAAATAQTVAQATNVWSKEQFEKASKGYAEMQAFSKEAVNDVVASSKATAEGLKAISAELTAFAKATAEENVATLKKLMSARTLSELVALHASYTNWTLDSYLAHSRKIGETTVATMKQAVQPLNARLADAAARVERNRAA